MGTEAAPMHDKDVLLDCLQRQLAELEALQAVYCGASEFVLADAEAEAVAALQESQESLAVSNRLVQSIANATLPQISFTINLLDTSLGGQHVSLHFRFPRKYPELEPLSLRVDCSGNVSKQQHQELTSMLQQHVQHLVGEESVLEAVQKLQELLPDVHEEAEAKPIDTSSLPGAFRSAMVCRVLWFHHLKALSKRKAICEWSKELQIGGYCKPGFPGVLVFEGYEDDVLEFQQRLQRLRWQAIQMRGEERNGSYVESDKGPVRKFPIGIQELSEGGMSELGTCCRTANLESLFLTALKIDK